MTFIIHYSGKYEDSITVSGEHIEELRETVKTETSRRGWNDDDCWSEKVSD